MSRARYAVLMLTMVGLWGAVVWPATAAAQEDFRSADLDRPIRVEDAFPVKFREWEIEFGGRAEFGEADDTQEALVELKTGLFLNTQVGLELVGRRAKVLGDNEVGVEHAGAHLLYNFNRETWSWPAFSARIDVESPGSNDVGLEEWSFTGKAIATRSFDRLRLHSNVGYTAADRVDGDDYWRVGLAFDYPLGLFSRSMMGDVYAEFPVDEGDTRVWTEFGMRWQLTNQGVLDFGLGTRLDEWADGEGNVQVVLGYSWVFGVPVLTATPRYPNPRID